MKYLDPYIANLKLMATTCESNVYTNHIFCSSYKAGALDKLEAFTSFNGPDFYGLPRNSSKIKLSKTPWKVPDSYSFSFGQIIPMFAGQTLEWRPCFD